MSGFRLLTLNVICMEVSKFHLHNITYLLKDTAVASLITENWLHNHVCHNVHYRMVHIISRVMVIDYGTPLHYFVF